MTKQKEWVGDKMVHLMDGGLALQKASAEREELICQISVWLESDDCVSAIGTDIEVYGHWIGGLDEDRWEIDRIVLFGVDMPLNIESLYRLCQEYIRENC